MFPIAIRIAVGVAVAVALVGLGIAIARRRSRPGVRTGRPLPEGADAALWSVVEVAGDPRNHLVAKDPTSELRITAELRRMAEDDLHARAFGETPLPRPAELAQLERSREARRAAEAKRVERLAVGGGPLPKRPRPAARPGAGQQVRPRFPSRAAS
jgi:hypothetical protein